LFVRLEKETGGYAGGLFRISRLLEEDRINKKRRTKRRGGNAETHITERAAIIAGLSSASNGHVNTLLNLNSRQDKKRFRGQQNGRERKDGGGCRA